MIFIRDLPPNAAPKEHLTSWLNKGLSVLACKNAFEIRWWAVCQFTQKKSFIIPFWIQRNMISSELLSCMSWHDNHFTSSCVISGAEFPELKRRKRQHGSSSQLKSETVWCIKGKSGRPANCVSLHSIDSSSFSRLELECRRFCALVTSLCVHVLSPRARSTLPDDAIDQCSVCGSQVCLQWMD